MVDFRPLLFLNALIVMLFLTAGFAHVTNPDAFASHPTISPSASLASPINDGDSIVNNATLDTIDRVTQDSSASVSGETASAETGPTPTDLGNEEAIFADSTTPFADLESADSVQTSAEARESIPTQDDSEPAPSENATLVATLDAGAISQPPMSDVPAVSVEAELPTPPTTGKLLIRSNVYDDQVRINGELRGSTALDLELAPGSYLIEITKPGYTAWSRTVELGRGTETNLSATLEQITTVEHTNGNWRYGITTGEGTYVNGDVRYEGGFLDKQFHGTGTLTLADGTRYEGAWANGQKEGFGTLKLPGGDAYVGQFHNDEFSGEGTLTKANGDIYAGTWRNGLLNGEGSLTTQEGLMYVGGFVDNQFSGEGTITYPDGTHYEGGFANNLYQGKGMLTYKDGKKYTGQFLEGNYHGKGELLNPNGSKITSTFKAGKPYGQVTLTTPHGEVFTARSSEPGVCYRLKSYRATQCPPMEGW